MSAFFHRIAATGRWVQAKTKVSVEQSINTRLRVAIGRNCITRHARSNIPIVYMKIVGQKNLK